MIEKGGSRGRYNRGRTRDGDRQQKRNRFTIASVNLTREDRLPIIELDVLGLKMDTLLDCFAAGSLISPDMLMHLSKLMQKISI